MPTILRFTRLRLRNWRNFTAVDVPLAKRMFVVGPNAVGKTNLLDAFRFLRTLTVEGGGLSQAVKARRGLARLRSLHQKGRQSDVEVYVESIDTDGAIWTYLLAFNRASGGSQAAALPLVKREVVTYRAEGDANARTLLERPEEDERADPIQLSQTAIQQVSRARAFSPLRDFFASVSYLNLLPQLIREEQTPPDDAVGGDHYGRDLLFRMRGTPVRSRDARLRRIKEVLSAAIPNLGSLELVIDDASRPHLQAGFRHWRGPEAKQDEREFSDGTLRLIGMLWAMQDSAGPLLMEEPELSLHAGIVRHLAPFISSAQRSGSGRQAFISTHSELLMSDPGIAAEEILLVRPVPEGSEVKVAADMPAIRAALANGLSPADVVMPLTMTRQLELFASLEP
jgi:predicted ATPase